MAGDDRASLPLPPIPDTRAGEARRVGVEIEMGGLDVERAAAALAEATGLAIEPFSPYEIFVTGDPAGRWAVELDFELLKARARARGENGVVQGPLEELAERLLRYGAEQILPVEVVSPPLPMPRLGEVEHIITALRGAGALGTSDNPLYAFGLQLNPELPDCEAGTILAYLQAFLLLYDWLREEAAPDIARRITGFADAFPAAYAAKVCEPGYAPALDTLIDDYLRYNPTRNRALDLLPLFAELDEARVRAVVVDERVRARPTLHYRLPNCEIGRADWGLHVPWRRWLQVEHLAADAERRQRLLPEFAAACRRPFGTIQWEVRTRRWLIPEADL